jgi:hypothetical protein
VFSVELSCFRGSLAHSRWNHEVSPVFLGPIGLCGKSGVRLSLKFQQHKGKNMTISPTWNRGIRRSLFWFSRFCILPFSLGMLSTFFLSASAHAQQGNASAQDDATAQKAKTQLKEASKQAFQLQTGTTNMDVGQNVSVVADMLPPEVTKHVFGNDIARNYAAITLTVSNRSDKASLIVHSIFIDYSRWLLSGYSRFDADTNHPDPNCVDISSRTSSTGDDSGPPHAQGTGNSNANPNPTPKTNGSSLTSWQSGSCPAQMASIEYRVVRDELLDMKPWTLRNIVVNSLVMVGSVASAYTFTLSGGNVVRSINAFTGQVIPAVQTFWPDSTIGQMNNISDLAFKVNKVIPQQSSDIVVAFYPLGRLFTPGLRKMFMKSPAAFYSPESMLIDPQLSAGLGPYLAPFLPAFDTCNSNDNEKKKDECNYTKFRSYYPQLVAGNCARPSGSATPDDLKLACQFYDMMYRLSLNTIRVVVGGSMTVDEDSVPSQIQSVDIPTPDGVKPEDMWTKTSEPYQCTIRGSFLTGGTPQIAEAKDLGLSIAKVSDGSTDTQLQCKITLTKALNPKTTKLTFTVSKQSKQGASITSTPYTQTITVPAAPTAPAAMSPLAS